MYKSFYSLSKNPFQKDINTDDLFISSTVKECQARLDYLKDTRGFGVISGEAGSGKTISLRAFRNSLSEALFKVMYFPLSTGTVMDFYRGMASGLGEIPCFRKVDLFAQIQKSVYSLFREKKITPVFVFDEMHLCGNMFLQDLNILFNYNMDSENPFILILCGQPLIEDRFTLSHNQSLSQRVIMRYHMEPMTKDEVAGYIEHHLKLAGANHKIFTEDAIEAIASLSRGWPRLINNLATSCLLYGYQHKKDLIDQDVVRSVSFDAGVR